MVLKDLGLPQSTPQEKIPRIERLHILMGSRERTNGCLNGGRVCSWMPAIARSFYMDPELCLVADPDVPRLNWRKLRETFVPLRKRREHGSVAIPQNSCPFP